MPFTDEQSVILQNVLRYEFHGILHFELRYSAPGDPPGTIRSERVASHIVYDNPLAGDKIIIERLMGMIHKVKKAPG